MIKCKARDSITYKDVFRGIGTIFDVEEKDIHKLLRQDAVINLEPIPEFISEVETKVEINVIKNPVRIEEKIPQEIIFREDKIDVEKKSDKKITWETDLQGDSRKIKKGKYNKRNKTFRKKK